MLNFNLSSAAHWTVHLKCKKFACENYIGENVEEASFWEMCLNSTKTTVHWRHGDGDIEKFKYFCFQHSTDMTIPPSPKLHNSQFLHKLTMAFIMQQWLVQDWRQAPVVWWHSQPLLAAFWRDLDKCRDQCCIINVNVSHRKQTYHRAQCLFHAYRSNKSSCHFPLPSKIINKFDQ